MSSSLTDPGERLRHDVARKFLDRYPGVLRGTDEKIAEAQAYGDTETAGGWRDFRAAMERCAEMSRGALDG